MDVNGTPFWQAASASEFGFTGSLTEVPENLAWDSRHGVVKLAGQQSAPAFVEDESLARNLLQQPSPACDEHGSFAWWDGPSASVLASGFLPGSSLLEIPDDDPAGVTQPTDMVFDRDILFLARNDGILMYDLRDRWDPRRIDLASFDVHLIAPIGDELLIAIDRTRGQLAYVHGTPMRRRGYDFDAKERFAGKTENPDPPRLVPIPNVKIPTPFEAVAVAGMKSGRAAILCWDPSNEAVILLWDGKELLQSSALENVSFPAGIAWDGDSALAILATDGAEMANRALAYDLAELFAEEDKALPNGRVYPLIGFTGAGFCNASEKVPRYLSSSDGSAPPEAVQKLRAISRPSFARGGHAQIGPFDSGTYDCNWHRLYLEGSFQGKTAVRVWARCSNQTDLFEKPTLEDPKGWAAHDFGVVGDQGFPQGSWCRHPSEVPGHPGISDCPSEPGKAGLFTVLLQHSNKKVRRLAGRYLYLYVEFIGDGQHSPELFALRAYGERFAYRDKYLPELYRETVTGETASDPGTATPSDFMDRFLGLFEGELTEIEGKVAQSWQYSDPHATPDDALPWLAQWTGIDPSDEVDMRRLRQKLACAAPLARLNGTLGGLRAQLEIETGGVLVRGGQLEPTGAVPLPGEFAEADLDGRKMRALALTVADPRSGQRSQILVGGGVTRGEIAIVEGFRLRRTFATILGADLADEHDPLTLGMVRSGNSIVGDTLILGEENNRKLLALFHDDLPKTLAKREAVDTFLEKLAFRTLVLVRDTVRTADIARIEKAAHAAIPAHVALDIVSADSSFLAGLSSLVGIDSFLSEPSQPDRVHVAISEIGGGDVVAGEGMLDPRADGPAPYPPVARADGPEQVMADSEFILSAERSSADSGRTIDRFIWTWN